MADYKEPSSQVCFENLYQKYDFKWNKLPRLVTVDTSMDAFQYKVLHNTLFLNQKHSLFHKVESTLCSFCAKEDEIVIPFFSHVLWILNCGKKYKVKYICVTWFNTATRNPWLVISESSALHYYKSTFTNFQVSHL